jgi:hypothetical protein
MLFRVAEAKIVNVFSPAAILHISLLKWPTTSMRWTGNCHKHYNERSILPPSHAEERDIMIATIESPKRIRTDDSMRFEAHQGA